jgi:hypothetical protein
MRVRNNELWDAVQWQPGMDLIGVRPATDDECYASGWRCGTAMVTLPNGHSSRIEPGDWLLRDVRSSAAKVVTDRCFRLHYEPTGLPS